MIIAAAVRYRITATGREAVLCGVRHGDIFLQLEALGFQPKTGYTELEQGFVDHMGRFLTRKEACHHAAECGQLPMVIVREKEKLGSVYLNSEDLW